MLIPLVLRFCIQYRETVTLFSFQPIELFENLQLLGKVLMTPKQEKKHTHTHIENGSLKILNRKLHTFRLIQIRNGNRGANART